MRPPWEGGLFSEVRTWPVNGPGKPVKLVVPPVGKGAKYTSGPAKPDVALGDFEGLVGRPCHRAVGNCVHSSILGYGSMYPILTASLVMSAGRLTPSLSLMVWLLLLMVLGDSESLSAISVLVRP